MAEAVEKSPDALDPYQVSFFVKDNAEGGKGIYSALVDCDEVEVSLTRMRGDTRIYKNMTALVTFSRDANPGLLLNEKDRFFVEGHWFDIERIILTPATVTVHGTN